VERNKKIDGWRVQRLMGGSRGGKARKGAVAEIFAGQQPGLGVLGEDLGRAETDPAFLARLHGRCDKLKSLFDRRREITAWSKLLTELIRKLSRQPE